MLSAGSLADALGALPVHIEDVVVRVGFAAMADYPGGQRPVGVVEVSGRGLSGFGENVAFTMEAQHAFRAGVNKLLPRGPGQVRELLGATLDPFERAALEGAIIDLALRQQRSSLGALAGASEGRLAWVSSFDAIADPVSRLRQLRARWAASGFKVDVSPEWTDEVIEALRAENCVVTLDFKGAGDPALCARLERAFPAAVFEDPPLSCQARSIALDRPLACVSDVADAVAAGRLVNLKAPRMGGFLEVLRSLEAIAAGGGRAYFGGMFEIGPGREQARQLAALYCPEALNDLGPLVGGTCSLEGPSPSVVALDAIGFGATSDGARIALHGLR